MKKIFLNNSLAAFVDDDDFSRLSGYRWYAHKSNPEGNWYAKRFDRTAKGYVKNIYMHREIVGALSHEEVDHIDRNGLNNRKTNLRLCNKGQNNANKHQARPASGFIGVFYYPKNSKPWRARCAVNRRTISLGYFSTPESAAMARDEFVRARWGEFATLNFPERAE